MFNFITSYKNLHILENVVAMKGALKTRSGIYCIRNLITGRLLSTTGGAGCPGSAGATTDSFPRVIEFTDLDQTKNLKAAKKALKGQAGVYAIINNITGAIYIGSSINIGNRLVDHLVENNT